MNKEIEKKKEVNFIIGNVLFEKEAICERIQQTIKQIQQSYINRAKEEDKELSPDKALEYYCNEIENKRNYLYHECRGANKHLNKKAKLIELINDFRSDLFCQNNNSISLSERKLSWNLLSERRGYCDNQTIPDQSNLEDSFGNDTNDFDEVNLDSDEDNEFETNSITEGAKLNRERIMKTIPLLNLRQIVFNKEKFRREIDENSIERRNRIEFIGDEIVEMKEKIRLLKKILRNNKKMEMNYAININKMNKYLIEKTKRKSMI